ncbi:transcriptional regulator with XRE-family HTH domain [Streptacidiphilus sp. MAP12-16]|uniref:helix-turn-helix domain-containing protein n=1 Tax=Streptacidiphilus sp. MAP12-16 TaxID=3156300 RepID=UPI003518ABD8
MGFAAVVRDFWMCRGVARSPRDERCAGMSALQSPTVRRRRLGVELRRLRQAAGLTIDDVACDLDCSDTKISRIETGKMKARQLDVRAMLDLYGVADGESRERLLQLNREARIDGWWSGFEDVLPTGFETFVGLEAEAAALRSYALAVVPGLLQTEAYARALFRAGHPDASAEQVERLVALRTTRQLLLVRAPSPLRLWAVVDEAVLRRPIGGREVMADQLRAMAELAHQANVLFQVLPFDKGAHVSLSGMFTLIEFPNDADSDVVYVEGAGGNLYLERPRDVREAARAFSRLVAAALDCDDSRRFILTAAEEL